MNHSDIKRKDSEDVLDYKYRICKDRTILGLDTWQGVADVLNDELEQNWTESTYRKWFSHFQSGIDYCREQLSDIEVIKDIEDRTLKLQKERFKYQDQKREYTNIVRQQARFEHIKDEIHKSILSLSKVKPLKFYKKSPTASNIKANTIWSDWHYGSDFKNSLNEYNPPVFKKRIEKLVSETISYCIKHNVSELTIGAVGDFLGGHIHVANRVQASEDVINQIQNVAETMAESLAEISKYVDRVKFINVIGNHARLISNKTESIFRENLENLIPWYLEPRLKEFENVEVFKDTDGYFVDYTYGEPFVYVHGDLDQVSSVIRSLPQMLGIVPKYVFRGHDHHDMVIEFGRTKVITNGSLVGTDDYAISKRYFAEPMQKMHIFNGSRIEYTIDIPLS